MPDIREILSALDEEDRRLYSQTRTRMRGAYLQALTEVVGIHAHDETDDALLDLIDIKVAVLFDRAGRFDAAEKPNVDEAAKIEKDISEAVTEVATKIQASQATAMMQNPAKQNGWGIAH